MTTTAEEIVTRIMDIDMSLTELREQREALRGVLLRLIPVGQHDIANAKVTIRSSRRFDPKKAAMTLDSETFARICQPAPVAALARAELDPGLYLKCCGPDQLSLVIT